MSASPRTSSSSRPARTANQPPWQGPFGQPTVGGKRASRKAMTTEAYLLKWLAHMKGRVRAVTYDGYEALVRVHAIPGLGSIPLASLHPLQIQDLYAYLVASGRISAKTVGNLHRVLRQSLSHAQNWRLIDRNPAAAPQPPRAKRTEPRIVDLDLAAV